MTQAPKAIRSAQIIEGASPSLSELNGHFQGYKKTFANGLEHEMAKGICEILENGSILHVGYTWRRKLDCMTNETDAIVTGFFKGDKVVVLGEAKLNMVKKWEDAIVQVKIDVERWKRLCQEFDSGQGGEELDAEDQKDISALQMGEHRNAKILIALGGYNYPESLKPSISKRLCRRHWFYLRKVAEVIHVQEVGSGKK